jgi:hypothetical protein
VTQLTMNLFILLGMETLYYWLLDEPDAIHSMMRLFTDDFIGFCEYQEREGLLCDNRDAHLTSGRYGYCETPAATEDVRLGSLWLWANAEEFTSISPEMFGEFVLPYMKEVCARFGQVYYACCDRLDDRFDLIEGAFGNLRAVSVSAFSNVDIMGEKLAHKKTVFSRKPIPWYFSNQEPYWELIEEDLAHVKRAAKDCNYELIFRDVYDIFGDRTRLARWVNLARA